MPASHIVLGAFGGAARDIPIGLGLMDGTMTHTPDGRYERGLARIRERAPRYRDAIRTAGVEGLAVELAGADTHNTAARLAMRIVRHPVRHEA